MTFPYPKLLFPIQGKTDLADSSPVLRWGQPLFQGRDIPASAIL